jgi:hypothetical protein
MIRVPHVVTNKFCYTFYREKVLICVTSHALDSEVGPVRYECEWTDRFVVFLVSVGKIRVTCHLPTASCQLSMHRTATAGGTATVPKP